MKPLVVAALVFAIAVGPAAPGRQQPDEPVAVGEQGPETPPSSKAREALDAAHEDLVELRFEKALAAIEVLLGEPDLTEVERVEALVLRAQAHVAFGDLDAAEQDYREILKLRSSYVPEASLTPSKAMKRFDKVRKSLVGRLTVTVDPHDAKLSLDGRPVTPGAEGDLLLLAGSHVLRAERQGYDAREQSLEIVADQEQTTELQLVPNARSVIVYTEPEEVEVRVDGQPRGRTRRSEDSPFGPAVLLLENLPLGEHRFELVKACHRTERRREIVHVDLLDRSPMSLGTIALAPALATLVLRGGPDGAVLFVDGAESGILPGDPLELCPGDHLLEVRRGARTVWRSTESLREASERGVQIAPRPNLVLLAEDGWPSALSELPGRVNLRRLPEPREAPETVEAWERLDLPVDTDLALARLRVGRGGEPDRWVLYSPILRSQVVLSGDAISWARPEWRGIVWGLTTVDDAKRKAVYVATTRPGGPAAAAGISPGDRVLSIAGEAVELSKQVAQRLGAAAPGRGLRIEWAGRAGATRVEEVTGSLSPRLLEPPRGGLEAALRAAWAVVDADAERDAAVSSAARANLALLYSAAGRHDLAVETWRRVAWKERAGLGRGTAQYYLGRELLRLGREAEALEAYRAAARGEATVFDDDGPRVAPAAEDRLTDLGQSATAP